MTTDNARHIALQYAEAEVIQARLEMNRLGLDIGSVPPLMQQHHYAEALAKLQVLKMADAISAAVSVAVAAALAAQEVQ